MPKLFVTDTEGAETEFEGESGITLMEVITRKGFDDLLALCGGACTCSTCHVYIDPSFADRLPPMEDMENELLEMSDHRQSNSRLSCQIPFSEKLEGIKVTIAPED